MLYEALGLRIIPFALQTNMGIQQNDRVISGGKVGVYQTTPTQVGHMEHHTIKEEKGIG